MSTTPRGNEEGFCESTLEKEGTNPLRYPRKNHKVIKDGRGVKYAVEAVERTAVPRQEETRIFYARETFEHGLNQISERRDNRQDESRECHFNQRQAENNRADEDRRQNRADNRAEETFHSFAGAYRRGELVRANRRADEVRKGVTRPRAREQHPNQSAARVDVQVQTQVERRQEVENFSDVKLVEKRRVVRGNVLDGCNRFARLRFVRQEAQEN